MARPRFVKPPSLLGQRLEVFGPWRANVYAGYILTGGFSLAGLGLIAWSLSRLPVMLNPPNSEEQQNAGFTFLVCLPGVAFLLTALAFGFVTRLLARCRLEVYEHGFQYWGYGHAGLPVLWSDLECIEERFSEDHVPDGFEAVALLGPSVLIRSLALIHRDGREFSFDRERVRGLNRFISLMKSIAEYRTIPWLVVNRESA